MQTKYVAPYILRLYVWEILKKNIGMSEANYDIDGDGSGYIPIVPLGEQPEFENFEDPYMVYGYAETQYSSLRTAGNMMFLIYATTFADLAEVANTIMKTFESDWIADEVNHYSSTIPAFIGIRFTNLTATTLEGASPEASAGGRMSATVNIRYEFVYDNTINTKLATWNGTKYVRVP